MGSEGCPRMSLFGSLNARYQTPQGSRVSTTANRCRARPACSTFCCCGRRAQAYIDRGIGVLSIARSSCVFLSADQHSNRCQVNNPRCSPDRSYRGPCVGRCTMAYEWLNSGGGREGDINVKTGWSSPAAAQKPGASSQSGTVCQEYGS